MSDHAYLSMLRQLANVVVWAPWLLLMLAAGIACLRRLATRPREGWLVGPAIVLLLFARFGIPNLVTLAVPLVIGQMGQNRIWMLMLLSDIPIAIVQVIAWSLILYAAFGEGASPNAKYLIEESVDEA